MIFEGNAKSLATTSKGGDTWHSHKESRNEQSLRRPPIPGINVTEHFKTLLICLGTQIGRLLVVACSYFFAVARGALSSTSRV